MYNCLEIVGLKLEDVGSGDGAVEAIEDASENSESDGIALKSIIVLVILCWLILRGWYLRFCVELLIILLFNLLLNSLSNSFACISGGYQFSDESLFDWGSDRIINHQNFGSRFEVFYNSQTDKYLFQNNENDSIQKAFVCNECQWNVLTKYVITQGDANEMWCEDSFGTSFASIHSDADNTEFKLLSDLFTYDGIGSYIGLDRLNETAQYSWIDGTTFDYLNGFNDTIWEDYIFNETDNCVITNNDEWEPIECDQSYSLICHTPNNKLCQKHNWITDDVSDWIWTNDSDAISDCSVYNPIPTGTTTLTNTVDVKDRLWTKLSLEYVFTVETHSDTVWYTGIVVLMI